MSCTNMTIMSGDQSPESKSEIPGMKRFLRLTKILFSRENEKDKNELESLKVFSLEEMRRFHQNELKRVRVFLYKITIITCAVMFFVFTLSMSVRHYVHLKNGMDILSNAHLLENVWIFLKVMTNHLWRVGPFYLVTMLLILTLVLLQLMAYQYLLDHYIMKKILITENTKKTYLLVSAEISRHIRSRKILYLALVLSLIIGLFWIEYSMLLFLLYISLFIISISYLEIKISRELNLGIDIFKDRRAKHFRVLELFFGMFVAVSWFLFSTAYMLPSALSSWETQLSSLPLSWHESVAQYSFRIEFDEIAGILFPYLFVIIFISALFFYIIPLITFDRIARRKYLVLLLSFIVGSTAVFVINTTVPRAFYLDMSSIIFILLILFLGHISFKTLESEIEEKVLEKICAYCGKSCPVEAEYCMFCGKKF